MNKKPVIKKIKFIKQEQEEIDLINRGQVVPTVKTRIDKKGIKHDVIYRKHFAYGTANKRLFELFGGTCTVCKQWPDYKFTYDVGDAKRIERYCQKCYDKRWKSR